MEPDLLAYDITVLENEIIRLDLYDEIIRLDLYDGFVVTEYVDGKKESKYRFVFDRDIYLLGSAENSIMDLQAQGYVSLQKLKPNFDVKSDNLLINIKLMMLRENNKLLEKVYDAHATIDGINVIKKYIRYIDVNTGISYVMYIGCEKWDEVNIMTLENEGYIDIKDSSLFAMLHELDRKNTLSRRIKCN